MTDCVDMEENGQNRHIRLGLAYVIKDHFDMDSNGKKKESGISFDVGQGDCFCR